MGLFLSRTKSWKNRGSKVFYSALCLQTEALVYTTPGKNAFLTAAYSILVPLLAWLFFKKKASKWSFIAALISLSGIALAIFENSQVSAFNFGDFLTLLCTFGFAMHILFVSKFSRDCNVLVFTIWQFIFTALFGLFTGMFAHPLPPVSTFLDPEFIGLMVYLIVFASVIAMTFMNVGLSKVPESQGSLLLSLEAVFAVLFSIFFTGEMFTTQLVIGFILVMLGVFVSELGPLYFSRSKA